MMHDTWDILWHMLTVVLVGIWRKSNSHGVIAEAARDWSRMTGVESKAIFSNLAVLIAPRMQAEGYRGSSVFRQEALRAVKNARLVDLWFLNQREVSKSLLLGDGITALYSERNRYDQA